ncbi:protein amalgam-like [Scylla paramamosain]|uniref:protein amalgam-like n=1 Tax=Scylla paramamosain TaxID=85552 RepID=UPI003083CB83
MFREFGGPFLRMSSLGRDDGGAFLCVASNGVPPAVSARAKVSVEFAPEMLGGMSVVWAEEGEKATLNCSFRAWPPPKVTWTQEGTQTHTLGGSLEQWKAQGVGSSQLPLSSLGKEDFGHYRCTVRNKHGFNSTLLTLVGYLEKVMIRERLRVVGVIGKV